MMKKKLSLIFLLLFSSALQANSNHITTGVTEIQGYTKNNEVIKITIETVEIRPNDPYHGGYRWGKVKWGHMPESQNIITNIKVLVANEEVLIPLSAYCDLANPYEVLFESEANQFSLIILGGHTGTPYKAELVFEQIPNTDYLRNRIKYRKVCDRSFPDEVWERTEYSFIIDDGR